LPSNAKVIRQLPLTLTDHVPFLFPLGSCSWRPGKRADNRPALQEALDATGEGDRPGSLLSLSRLARSTRDTIDIAEALSKQGADLVSLSEKIDTTTAAGKMVFRMLAVLSEFERDQVSERTRLALAHKRANGEKTGGDVPFGFRLRRGKLVPHVKEQRAIALIQELRERGSSLRAIAAELKDQGYRTKTGRKNWNPKTVSTVLERELAAA
jgi:site-specific DNA recombinase